MSINQFGTTSKLSITACSVTDTDGRQQTVMRDCFFTAPFKVMKPFPRTDGGLTIYQQTASAGVMAGDIQEFTFKLEKDACLELVSQSFEKIFKMDEGSALRSITASVGSGGLLLYTPLPCIPFGGSDFSSHTIISLADETARLVYEDCISCGRKGHGEAFAYRQYENLVEIKRHGKLIYRDNTVFRGSDCGRIPENGAFMQNMALYGNYSHLGTLFIAGFNETAESIREKLGLPAKFLYTPGNRPAQQPQDETTVLAGVTTSESGDIVVRALGTSAEQIQNFFAPLKLTISRLTSSIE